MNSSATDPACTQAGMVKPSAAPDPSPSLAAASVCGHLHFVDNYAHGCAYGTHMTLAYAAAHNDDEDTASRHATNADRALWPLMHADDPDSLRDFIAGVANSLESHLRALGTPITD